MINEGLNTRLYQETGVYETNGLKDSNYHNIERIDIAIEEITKSDKVSLERLRMVTDVGFPFYDISYIHITYNGKPANLIMNQMQLNKRTWKSDLIQICKNHKVFIEDIVNPMKVSILK